MLLSALCVCGVSSISFKLPHDMRKCVREEVHKDVLVVGEYDIAEVQDQRTDLLVSVLSAGVKDVR